MKQTGLLLIGVMLLGTQVSASGCSDMAAFNTQINKFLKTASISDTLKSDVKQLANECEAMHDQGMPVSNISSCTNALKLTMVN
jgi:outer membrane murein-binding lipoprotein Lpp